MGILPMLFLYLMLICIPIIGCVFDLDQVSENSNAPHKLFESHRPTE